jgi:hypothetical protein
MRPHCGWYTRFDSITKTLMRSAMRLISRCVSFAYKSSKRNAELIALRFDGRAELKQHPPCDTSAVTALKKPNNMAPDEKCKAPKEREDRVY